MPTEIHGSMLLSFIQACINHEIILQGNAEKYEIDNWYDVQKYHDLCNIVQKSYIQPDPIFHRIGKEMIKIWYHAVGKDLVKCGMDFLKFQTGSKGYYNVVKGDAGKIGNFELSFLDTNTGIAHVTSTTPLNRRIEAGVLVGGLTLFPEINFSTLKEIKASEVIIIEFH